MAKQLTLNKEIILDYPGGPNVITRALKNGRHSLTREQRDGSMRAQPDVGGFKHEKMAMSQGNWVASKDGKGKEMASPRASRMECALLTP